jgi:mersacidin/lichenicidin family type 2 lantibiotic
MSIQEIIRAWRDKEFRQSLSEEQQTQLPNNPIGETLSQEELQNISGGMRNQPPTTCLTDGLEYCTCWKTDPYTECQFSTANYNCV